LDIIIAEVAQLLSFAVFRFWSLKMHKHFGLTKCWIFSKEFTVTVAYSFQNKRHFTAKDPFAKRSVAENKAATNMAINMQEEAVLLLFQFSQNFVSHKPRVPS
jgi:hypothetical protein